MCEKYIQQCEVKVRQNRKNRMNSVQVHSKKKTENGFKYLFNAFQYVTNMFDVLIKLIPNRICCHLVRANVFFVYIL